jgi:hypothetical protein
MQNRAVAVLALVAASGCALPGAAAEASDAGPLVLAAGEADSCAKALPPESRLIYDATVKNMRGTDTIRDTVVAQTKALVIAGKIPEANARPAAEAAGTCLRLLAKS